MLTDSWMRTFYYRVLVTDSGCLTWTGNLHETGYGKIGRAGKTLLTHRLSYELANGPIPQDMTVDHVCFVRPCINPYHLRLLTWSENSSRKQPQPWLGCGDPDHPPSTENTYIVHRTNGRVERGCKPCRRDRQLRHYERAA